MFKNLKSLFIEDDGSKKKQSKVEEAVENEEIVPNVQPKSNINVENSATDPTVPQEAAAGTVSDKFLKVLFGALEKNNIDGFDYFEYRESLKSLEKMPMDEKTRYQSAFAMAKTMGATPQRLVETAGHYINVLKKEEAKFQQALVQQKSKQIGGREQQYKQLQQAIQQKKEQINKLTQEIEQHEKQLGQIKQEVSSASVKVEATKNNFVVTYDHIVSKIMTDIENMKKYLK